MKRKIHVIYKITLFIFCFLLSVFLGGISVKASFEPKEFSVPKDINSCTITLSKTNFSYSSSKCGPEVTVRDGTMVLTEGVDYTLFGATAATIGKHEITILGTGNYTGQATAVFQIQKARNEINIYGNTTYYTYSNPESYDIHWNTKGGAKLTFSTKTRGASITKDGVLILKDGFLGTVQVKVKAAETEFYQAAVQTFSIKFKLKGTRIIEIKREGVIPDTPPEDDHTVKIFWKTKEPWEEDHNYDMQSVDGFQIRYSTDSAFQSRVYKTKIPMINALTALVDSCTISSHLKKGDKVYFQIRTYKKAIDGKTYYSSWSKAVSHKVDSSEKAFYKDKKPKNGKTYSVGGIVYKYRNKKLEAVAMTNPKQLKIPDMVSIYGKKYPVESIKSGAFEDSQFLYIFVDKIIIGKNVKKIGKNAFANNRFVREVIINSRKLTPKSVGKNAFKNVGTIHNEPVKLKAPKNKKASYKKILQKTGLRNLR